MFRTVMDDFGVHPGSTALATFKWNSISIPHAVRSRHGQKRNSPWIFVIDQFNVPQVYWESVNCTPPPPDQLEDLSNFVFRIGGWYCGRGAYRFDASLPVILLFTPPTTISRRIVSDTLFEYLYKDPARDLPDMNEAGLAWLFLKLQNLLSDFNNVTGLVEKELNNAVSIARLGLGDLLMQSFRKRTAEATISPSNCERGTFTSKSTASMKCSSTLHSNAVVSKSWPRSGPPQAIST